MGHPTKTELHYKLPEQCCANCVHSCFNTYDDKVCPLLSATDCLIDAGGVCDKWTEDK